MAIEHERVLRLDFLKKQTTKCDYETNDIKIKDSTLKLHPCNKIILNPRNDTIIKAATNQNQRGIVRTEEITPSSYWKLSSRTKKFFMSRERNKYDRSSS